MKKKTVLIIAIVLSAIMLVMYVAVCFMCSLWNNENKAYIAGLVILPLLPFILLLATLPTPRHKIRVSTELRGPSSENCSDETEIGMKSDILII